MEECGDQKAQLLGAVHKVIEGKWLEWIVTEKWNEELKNLEKHPKRGGLGEAEEQKCKSRMIYQGVCQYLRAAHYSLRSRRHLPHTQFCSE
jgi:hypothetical protein